MGVWAPTDSEVCEAIRSHSLNDLNYFKMILLGSSTGVHVLFCFLLSLGSLINQVKGVLQVLEYTLEGSGPISRYLPVTTYFACLCPLCVCGRGEGQSLLHITQMPFMSEVFYENRSATWQHLIVPCRFFSILPMTSLSTALRVEFAIINNLMTFLFFKTRQRRDRRHTFLIW